MSVKVIVGAQWGDEGKGKVIDILASRSDVVVRAQGGDNAGHTVVVGDEVYKLHLIPSGILYPECLCLVGCGIVVNPKSLLTEMDSLIVRGITCKNLRIDPRAHIVMPWHILLDRYSEELRGKSEIGTTNRGIGPCYMDKAERSGIRFYDLIHPELLKEKIEQVGGTKNRLFTTFYGKEALDLKAIYEEYAAYGQRLAAMSADVSVLTYNAIQEGKEVLLEGAQGALLDLDTGTYPYVTSSHPTAGGFCVGIGLGPTFINEIIGATKAYTTRVGKGPFPTELLDEIGDGIRTKGGEFGTTTGRPRRIGWFDAVIVRHAARVNGLTALSLNKLDTLSGQKTLKLCTGYRLPDGSVITDFPPTIEELADCEPVYIEMLGWEDDLTAVRSFDQLPKAATDYIAKIESLCGVRVSMVGIGPDRCQNIER